MRVAAPRAVLVRSTDGTRIVFCTNAALADGNACAERGEGLAV
jgi:hypothetical protein